MKKFLLTAVFAFIGTLVFSQERIAVFPFEDMENVLTRNESVMFYREFSNEFTNRSAGRFSVVPRQEVERLINTEAAFQLSDFSARAKTAEMQRVLNGTQILSGLIGKLGNSIRITVSLYTYPELVQLPGGTTLSVANTTELFSKIPELVQRIQNEITGKRNGAGVTGATAMYKVGDIGPAGGIIFYDRGFIADGWRYLEAAPTDFRAPWGADEKNVAGTDTVIGSGKRNTQIIVEYLNRIGVSNRAAQICAAMNVNGFTDWFLPSIDELDLIYWNLQQRGLGGFGGEAWSWYWSSSQSSFISAWLQNFGDGDQLELFKSLSLSVRAVRAF